ncbi:MAG: PHP domain-containing protein [Oscillospiraceae bacterium]|nr:PHP domain-containing protein [Oscillospiraceae bacterium]
MASKVDLHIHTTASDGADTPRALAEKIAAAGLELFSVTDHDTISGALEMETIVPQGVRYIRGVEFSCVSPAGKCHILGYGYDPDHPAFRGALEEGRRLRLEKLDRRLEQLRRDHGIELTDDERTWLMSLGSPGKPHLGQIIRNRGLAPDLDGAIRGFIRDVPGRDRIEASTAIGAITAAGGFPVWAHPLGGEGEKRLTEEKFEALLETLLGYGLRGMECRYSRYGRKESEFLLDHAARLGLTPTGGSDYHGSNKKGIQLGQLGCEWTVDKDTLYGIICK